MIKTLKRKIVFVTLLSVGLVLLVMVSAMNIANYYRVLNEADATLAYLAMNDGKYPSRIHQRPGGMRPEAPFDTRYFSVSFNSDKIVASVDVDRIVSVSETDAVDLAQKVLDSKSVAGLMGNYRYLSVSKDGSTQVIFLDVQREMDAFIAFLTNSLLIAGGGMLSVLALSMFFSKFLLKPVELAYAKQQRFITDASHELKTPITIINANMDVLGMEHADNEWIKSTHRQVDRMNQLVNDMLFLAKMDESGNAVVFKECDVKAVLEHVLEDFEPYLSRSYQLEIDFAPVDLKANAELLYRLFYILIENALRYGISNTQIKMILRKQHQSGMCFVIENDAHIDSNDNLEGVFDRFFRLDKSRNQANGGSGIGLSIAKSIVEIHKGSIRAVSDDGLKFKIIVEI